MSGRGIYFLEDWCHLHVTDAARKGSRERAQAWASECIAHAAVHGITIDDMEPEWGSVETIIYEAMENDMDAELEFWKTFAAARTRTLGY